MHILKNKNKKMKIFIFVLFIFLVSVNADIGACLLNNAANQCVDSVDTVTCSTYGGSVNATTFVNATLCSSVTGNPNYKCCQLTLDFTPPCQNITVYECTVNGGTASNSQVCDFNTCPLYIGACTDPINNTCTENLLASDCAYYNSKSDPGLSCDAAYIKPKVCHLCREHRNEDDDDENTRDCHKCNKNKHRFMESFVLASLSEDKSVTLSNLLLIN